MSNNNVLILGGGGLLGQSLCSHYSKQAYFNVYATSQNSKSLPKDIVGLKTYTIQNYSATNYDHLANILLRIRPRIIINTIVKKNDSKDSANLIEINSIYPLKLFQYCKEILDDFYLIHMSSDAVFSGESGNYSEIDIPDSKELYGLSKLSGELQYNNCLTIRTSIYGRDRLKKEGILEWFLSSGDSIEGYTNVYFSGVSTDFLSRKIIQFAKQKDRSGILHLPGQKISKYELLRLFNRYTNHTKKIVPVETSPRDLSLVSNISNNKIPKQQDMIKGITFEN